MIATSGRFGRSASQSNSRSPLDSPHFDINGEVSRSGSNQTGCVDIPAERVSLDQLADIVNAFYREDFDLLVGRYGRRIVGRAPMF